MGTKEIREENGRKHREEIDSRNAARIDSLREEIKEMKETRENLKEISKAKRKEELQNSIREFREDFGDPTYFVELSDRASNRLNSLNQSYKPNKSYILERMISLSLTNLDKTKPLLARDLYLDEFIDKETARQELGDETVETLEIAKGKDLNVNL